MQRVCLAFLRFCLSAWVGIAIFFVMVVIDLRHSKLFDDDVKFNHPKILFPLYYGFEFSLLGTALVCACVGLWNSRIAKTRRIAVLALLAAASLVAVWDYAFVYRQLVEMMGANVVPADFVRWHQLSRWLNETVLGISLIGASLALWPEAIGSGCDNSRPHDISRAD